MMLFKNKKKEMDMLNGPMWKNILLFAIPIMLTSCVQLLFHTVDVAVVGSYCGAKELAAVGSNNSVVSLLVNTLCGFSIASNVIIARFIGAKDKENVKSAIGTSLILATVSGILITVIGLIFTDSVLKLISTPSDITDLASIYLKIYFLGVTPSMIYSFSASILRSNGETTKPFLCLATGGIINVLLNLYMVILLNLGVVGVASATVISNVISCVLVLIVLFKSTGDIAISIKEIKFKKSILFTTIKTGLPMAIQAGFLPLTNLVVQSAVNTFGTTVIAGNAAATSIESYYYAVEGCFSLATISFVSQNFGAKNLKRCRKALRESIGLNFISITLFCSLLYIFMPYVLRLFTADVYVMAVAREKLIILMFSLPFILLMNQFTYALRGLGHSLTPSIVAIMGILGLRTLWVKTVAVIINTYASVMMAYFISAFSVSIVLFICYRIIIKKEMKKLEVN